MLLSPGAVSAPMIASLGPSVAYSLVGHSERRSLFHETDTDINASLLQLLATNSVTPVLCVGETLKEYQEGRNEQVCTSQLQAALEGVTEERAGGLVIAYEPVWAIGTGLTATPDIGTIQNNTIQSLIS